MRIAVVQRKQWSYAMAIVATLIVLAIAVPVSAAPLSPGGIAPVPLFTDAPGTLVDAFIFAGVNPPSSAYTGTLISAVYQTATGGLEFNYQFINAGPGDVHRLTGFNFTGYSTDVGYRDTAFGSFAAVSLGASLPIFADRDAAGATVGFEFAPGSGSINAGETSVILAIKTDAAMRESGWASVINGGAESVLSHQPTGTPIPPADVPEPATLLLLGSAVVGMGLGLRRRVQR